MSNFLYNNSVRFRLLRHSLFFLVTVLIFACILFMQNQDGSFFHTIWVTLLNSLFFFSYAYITIFLLIPEFLIKGKVVWFLVLLLLIGIALSALKLVVSDYIFYSSIAPENIGPSGFMDLRFIIVNTKDMSFIVALFCIAKYVKDYLYAERFRKELEVENKIAQVKLIQSQFDPHFLFNTINNLYALSLLNPTKTKEVIQRIKIVLKYINEEIQKDYVSLKDELLLVENYIHLEKLRYGKRLNVDFRHKVKSEKLKVPPMVVFFMVENCFKHGSSLDAGTPWIKIKIDATDQNIHISTKNSKPEKYVDDNGTRQNEDKLINLRKRLDILYEKDGYDLKIDDLKNLFEVELKLSSEIDIQKNKYR